MHGAGEILRPRQMPGCSEQHYGVAVMAAGMHGVGRARLIGTIGQFGHGERIHIGAERNTAGAVTNPKRAHEAGFPKPAMHFDTRFFELFGDDGTGADFLEAQFGMGMKIAAQRRHGFEFEGIIAARLHWPARLVIGSVENLCLHRIIESRTWREFRAA